MVSMLGKCLIQLGIFFSFKKKYKFKKIIFRVAWKSYCRGQDLSSYTSQCSGEDRKGSNWSLSPDFQPGIQAPLTT